MAHHFQWSSGDLLGMSTSSHSAGSQSPGASREDAFSVSKEEFFSFASEMAERIVSALPPQPPPPPPRSRPPIEGPESVARRARLAADSPLRGNVRGAAMFATDMARLKKALGDDFSSKVEALRFSCPRPLPRTTLGEVSFTATFPALSASLDFVRVVLAVVDDVAADCTTPGRSDANNTLDKLAYLALAASEHADKVYSALAHGRAKASTFAGHAAIPLAHEALTQEHVDVHQRFASEILAREQSATLASLAALAKSAQAGSSKSGGTRSTKKKIAKSSDSSSPKDAKDSTEAAGASGKAK